MSRIAPNRLQRTSGSVFVFALWVIIFLALFSLAVAQNASQRAKVYEHFVQKETLRRELLAAVTEFTLDIRNNFLKEDFVRWQRQTFLKTYDNGKVEVELKIIDDSERINLNYAQAYALKNLIHDRTNLSEERSEEIALAVIDYRDADDLVGRFGNRGSESTYYLERGLKQGPKNRFFEFEEELRNVPGITKEIYDSLKGYITIYGSGSINLNAASQASLMALDLPESLAEKLVRMRETHVFSDIAKIAQDVETLYSLNDDEKMALDHAVRFGQLSVGSTCYRVLATARYPSKPFSVQADVLFVIPDGIKYWREI